MYDQDLTYDMKMYYGLLYSNSETTLICVFVCVGNFNCSGDFHVNCGGSHPKKPCIHQERLCDEFDDCGNKWDELPETCGQFAVSSIY